MAARLATPVQSRLFWLSVFSIALSAVGLAVNSDFSTGDDLTSSWFLVDWNGWHALSGFLFFAPGVAAALYSRSAATAFCIAGAFALPGPALLSLFDKTPLGLLDFPHVASDVVFHLVFAAALLAIGLPELRARRATTA